jgi:hypothetical protein
MSQTIREKHPLLLLYLQSVEMLAIMDEIDFPENGFRKSIRSINSFAVNNSEYLNEIMPKGLERAVHNYNVIQNSISVDVLEQEIGGLTVLTK